MPRHTRVMCVHFLMQDTAARATRLHHVMFLDQHNTYLMVGVARHHPATTPTLTFALTNYWVRNRKLIGFLLGTRPELKSDEFSVSNPIVIEISRCEDLFTAEKVLDLFRARPSDSFWSHDIIKPSVKTVSVNVTR